MGVASGAMLVHDGKDIGLITNVREERMKLVMRMIFLLNITKVGYCACVFAVNLVVVDLPEGVERIGVRAIRGCSSLTNVSFLTTLKVIGQSAFYSLENVDLLHTNLQEIGDHAFWDCPELKSMKIPDSLRTIGDYIFYNCHKLVPSNIAVNDCSDETTSDVVAHLRSQQLLPLPPPNKPSQNHVHKNKII